MSVVDRIEASLRAIVLSIFEEKLYGQYPYAVRSFDVAAQTVSANPVGSAKLPPIANVSIRTPRLQLVLHEGDEIVVSFAGGDPTAPFVSGYGAAVNYASALAVARQGDMVMTTLNLVPAVGPAGPIPGVFSITITVPPPPPFVPGVGGPAKFFGIISSGSVRVKVQ